MKYGPLELSGNLQTQNIIRNPDIDEYHFVQQRNAFRARVDWIGIEKGKWIDRIDVPFVESSKLFLLYRGSYDSIYDYTPTSVCSIVPTRHHEPEPALLHSGPERRPEGRLRPVAARHAARPFGTGH